MSNSEHLFLALARIRRRLFHNYKVARWVVGGAVLVVVLGILSVVLSPLLRIGKDLFFGQVGVFSVVIPSRQEIKSTNGRTNILLLGTGGARHDGPNLTDTIIVASIKTKFGSKEAPAKSPIILISIPRDVYLDSLKGKINTAYAIGADRGKGTGLVLAEGAVSEITGLTIHYGVRVDFSAFEQIVDTLGGIDVNVEHTFDDFQYPVEGKEDDTCGFSQQDVATISASLEPETPFTCRYEHIHFDAGPQHMDGTTALKFVRSRHAASDEGTDFARAKRQQLVIDAIKSKIFSTDTFLHLDKLEEIYNVLKSHVDTDFDPSQGNNLLNLGLKYRQSKFENVVVGTDLLENPPIDERGWILVPKSGDWNQIHQYIKAQTGK